MAKKRKPFSLEMERDLIGDPAVSLVRFLVRTSFRHFVSEGNPVTTEDCSRRE